MKVTTVENLFTPSVLGVVQQQFTDPLINWGTYDPALCKDQRLYDWYQMTHMIWDNDDPLSPLYDLAAMVLAQAMDKSGRQLKRLFRARLINSHPGDLGRAMAHIDLQGPHNTGLFFPMASSGNTVIYKERSMLESWDRAESLTVAQELEPKENTWYDFDGTHWRISGRPVDHDQRICLVINFIATTPQPLE
jgi:hypothetical protein